MNKMVSKSERKKESIAKTTSRKEKQKKRVVRNKSQQVKSHDLMTYCTCLCEIELAWLRICKETQKTCRRVEK